MFLYWIFYALWFRQKSLRMTHDIPKWSVRRFTYNVWLAALHEQQNRWNNSKRKYKIILCVLSQSTVHSHAIHVPRAEKCVPHAVATALSGRVCALSDSLIHFVRSQRQPRTSSTVQHRDLFTTHIHPSRASSTLNDITSCSERRAVCTPTTQHRTIFPFNPTRNQTRCNVHACDQRHRHRNSSSVRNSSAAAIAYHS